MRAFLHDLRYGARSLWRRPGVSVAAVLSLAVGIGVTTTAYSLLNALILRDLPGIAVQERVVQLGVASERTEAGRLDAWLAWPDVEVLRERRELFVGVAAAGTADAALAWSGDARAERVELVSPDYFRVLGTRPRAGRLLMEADDVTGVRSVVLSHRVHQRMGAPADAVGRKVELNGTQFTVVGVAPEGFTGMIPGDLVDTERASPAVWVALAEAPLFRSGDRPLGPEAYWLRVVARIGSDVSRERLASGLAAAGRALERTYPDRWPGASVVAGDLRFGPGASPWRPFLIMAAFLVVPVLILLIGCANAASLLLAHNAERERELAVRSALGAARPALFRQLLAESLVLALAAGGLGLAVAYWSRQIAAFFAVRLSMDAPLDPRVFFFAFAIAVGAGLALGLLPAARASRPDVADALSGAGRSAGGRRSSRLRRGLVVVQVALSLTLLVVGGLFVRSATHGLSVDSGLDEDRLAVATVDLEMLDYSAASGRDFYHRLLDGVRGLPAVNAAALAGHAPLSGLPRARVAAPEADPTRAAPASVARVGEGWFVTTGVDLLAGREPRSDGAVAEAVVSRVLAEELWPDGPPGSALRVVDGGRERLVRVVGVAADARTLLHQPAEPVVYLAAGPEYTPRAALYVRAEDPGRVLGAVRDVVRRLDPRLPLHTVETARQARDRRLLPWRLMARALASLGTLALVLAVSGLYGVISFSVARRTREIGVRLALGAGRAGVVAMVLRESLALTGIGVLAGGVLAAGAAVLLQSLLFGVSPLDPVTYGSLAALLVLVAVLAAAVPAWRAARVEPVRALSE